MSIPEETPNIDIRESQDDTHLNKPPPTIERLRSEALVRDSLMAVLQIVEAGHVLADVDEHIVRLSAESEL